MRIRSLVPAIFALVSLALAACGGAEAPDAQDPSGTEASSSASVEAGTVEISFPATDGVTVWGDLHRGGGERPLILLFHQGGASARAEYAYHVPLLMERGFDVLAVDARAGGDLFGGMNRTAAAFTDEEPSYCEASADLEATLDYALDLDGVLGRPVLWGSSYSAALVIRLAADRPADVSGVLAFSPASGEPMDGCRPEEAATRLSVPALALRPEREAAIPSVQNQMAALEAAGLEAYVSVPGAHGSSMLHPDRVEGDVAPTWQVVDAFLTRLAGAAGG